MRSTMSLGNRRLGSKLARGVAVIAVAGAMVALPAVHPVDVSAKRMSERSMNRACGNAGGSLHYDIWDSSFANFGMICTLPSGRQILCTTGGGPFGGMLDCF